MAMNRHLEPHRWLDSQALASRFLSRFFEWVEVFYNCARRRSALGYLGVADQLRPQSDVS